MIWSYSTSRMFARCQRQWCFKCHVANANATKQPLAREAYILSKLQSIHAWRGDIVDSIVGNKIVPALEHGWELNERHILRSARSLFEQRLAFANAHRVREAGMTRKLGAEAFAALYAIEYDEPISELDLECAWNDVEKSLNNFLSMGELCNLLGRASKLVSQRPLMFHYYRMQVRAVPDLIAFFADEPPLIVDWKVNAFGSRIHRRQLATYALALAHCQSQHKDFPTLTTEFLPMDFKLFEVQLLHKQIHEYQLTAADVEDAENYIAQSMTEMTYADGGNSRPHFDPYEYPVAFYAETCERCSFRKICWEKFLCQESKQMSLL